jgi:hypothetical protein
MKSVNLTPCVLMQYASVAFSARSNTRESELRLITTPCRSMLETEAASFSRDFWFGPMKQWSDDRWAVRYSEGEHVAECIDELGSTVRVTRVVDGIDSDPNLCGSHPHGLGTS